jgi:hypothetical protein
MDKQLRKVAAYYDHENTIHLGPEPCPWVGAMGAAITLIEAMRVLSFSNTTKLCDACHDRVAVRR